MSAAANKPSVLVTGGAGYVGSHVCKALANAGYMPVVYDNLATGHRWAVKWGPLEEGDVRDSNRIETVRSLGGSGGGPACTHRSHRDSAAFACFALPSLIDARCFIIL